MVVRLWNHHVPLVRDALAVFSVPYQDVGFEPTGVYFFRLPKRYLARYPLRASDSEAYVHGSCGCISLVCSGGMVVRLWNHREWRHGRQTMEPPRERSPGLETMNSALRAWEVQLHLACGYEMRVDAWS